MRFNIYNNFELMGRFYDSDYFPPLLKIFGTPLIVIWFVIAVILLFLSWLLGFWICSDCNLTFPFNHKKHFYYAGGNREDGPNKYKQCTECKGL